MAWEGGNNGIRDLHPLGQAASSNTPEPQHQKHDRKGQRGQSIELI